MGIFDNLQRLFSASPPQGELKDPKPGELGMDGEAYQDVWLGGPDVNPMLSGQAKYPIYDEMRKTDPAVRSILLMFKLPILSAEWTCEPYSDSPEDKLVAECVEQQFGLGEHDKGWLSETWESSLGTALQFLDWGSMFEEIVWGDPFKWTPGEKGDKEDPGEETTVRAERLIRPILKLAPRKPATINEITTAKDGSLHSLSQDTLGARPIPGDKLVWYVNEREDNEWFGVSLLRAAFAPWRMKRALMIAAGIGFDRYAAGVPVIRYPAGSVEGQQKAELIGSRYRTHERAWITLPGAPPPQGDWDVSILSGNGSMADPIPLLRHLDEQIATAALQGFTRLGVTETGSRAVGEVLADPYYLAVQATARYIATQREKLLISRFVRVNFGDDTPMPKLLVSKITADNTAQVVEAIANLSGAGWNMADRDLQNMVRIRLGIPELPEGEPTKGEGAGLNPSPSDVAAIPEAAPPELPPADTTVEQ